MHETSNDTTAMQLSLVCGPTCGCGKSTPFTRTMNGWMAPAACMHCGKSFGSSLAVIDRPTHPHAALLGFAAWLTTRPEPVTFGTNHDAAPAAELVAEFVKSQGWPDLPENWTQQLRTYPSAST
jgi:hypothetical protein